MARKVEKISISSIAAELHISPASVSRVINNRTGVSEETRRQVAELLRKYQFKANYPASRSRKIAIVQSSPKIGRYASTVVAGIYDFLQKQFAGTELRERTDRRLSGNMIFYSSDNRESLLSILRDQQCAGAILIMPAGFDRQLPELAQSELPIMLVDEQTDLPNIGYIDNDSYSGIRQAMQYLLDGGHRNIAFLPREGVTSSNQKQRLQAYYDAMTEANLTVRPEWVPKFPGGENLSNPEYGKRLLEQLMTQSPEISAVLTADDNIAYGALRGAHAMGISIPNDLSIIGFDDYEESVFSNPPLTTIRHPMAQAGAMAAEAIYEFLQNNGIRPLPRRQLQTELVIRDSSAPYQR